MEKAPFKNLINKNLNQEVPSVDFTKQVMQKVELHLESKKIIEPLIPSKWMKAICITYLLIFVLPLILFGSNLTFSFLNKINIGGVNPDQLKQGLQLSFNLIFVFGILVVSEKLLSLKRRVV